LTGNKNRFYVAADWFQLELKKWRSEIVMIHRVRPGYFGKDTKYSLPSDVQKWGGS